MNKEHRHLAYFLGPKAENSNLLESLLSTVVHDNFNWRRSYYPNDGIFIDKAIKTEAKGEHDSLTQNVNTMMAELRKNPPFHSPRYIAHMLSDTTMPALIGYIAGLLYNPNNVTPEAAPVTVEWEIQACNKVLEMLGYMAPPDVVHNDKNFNMKQYRKSLKETFGWSHITFGGTLSNIEALWVARNIKYMALAIHDVALQKELNILVKQTNGIEKNIQEFTEKEILLIRPEDAIDLLTRYFEAVFTQFKNEKRHCENLEKRAWEWLNESSFSLVKGTGDIFKKYPPVIFVTGASHYSIDKAADILGIGKENIKHVQMDSRFRMDTEDLKKKIKKTLLQDKIPLAVIAIAGTTEEGSVDPIHDIVNIRNDMEANSNASFWLHIDGAWGGYIRTLFTPGHIMDVFINISKQLEINFDGDINTWNEAFFNKIEKRVTELHSNTDCDSKDSDYTTREFTIMNGLMERKGELAQVAKKSDIEAYFSKINDLNNLNKGIWVFSSRGKFNISLEDRLNLMKRLVTDNIKIEYGSYRKEIAASWDDHDVLSSYYAFPFADSITMDAHKMGYVPYSCGIVAYKNDRIRNFIYQKAPYIAGLKKKSLIHYPPKHIIEDPAYIDQKCEEKYLTRIESFAPFTLEGSKSGAAACSLWLATKTIPLTLGHHGSIIRSSILGARELYEWLAHWAQINIANNKGKGRGFEFVPLVKSQPDTNIVIFIVKNNTVPTLTAANDMTMDVYKNFGVHIEEGQWDDYNARPFFLSKTTFDASTYSVNTLRDFFKDNRLENAVEEYGKSGLTVLRATVMNPYVYYANKTSSINYFQRFMETISQAAERYLRDNRSKFGKIGEKDEVMLVN